MTVIGKWYQNRHPFGQVLETELRKPMTIRLLAGNTKVPS
jgi:hypothetical protein